MDASKESDGSNNVTDVTRVSDRELVVTRRFNAPARLVFEAWTKPELFRKWWAPASIGMTFLACEMDARTGGKYRMEFSHPCSEQPAVFYGRYLEVTPYSKVVWTNEEGDGEGAVTTVTFEEQDGQTRVVMHDLHPSKEALDEAIDSGSTSGTEEQFAQLNDVLASSAVATH
ncbi:SRPBCC family protein [Rhodanobacter sp. AS-Z3]|uniref:SRPBCC family protein n=1 Tax=Rhodanobacter sp. AS-Z3 TaxID=3031330 RepID=UPI002479A8FD|nr:SRPBCC family protein [Rhodanobacter sp. AS-Z3]WEN14033.1 SRPBCC family protein [Rhodanobacter sp. AS-Z3]